MEGYTKLMIVGGVLCGEGGPFLLIGVMYLYMFQGLSFLNFIWWTFIIIGLISVMIGAAFLFAGLLKRSSDITKL